VAQSRTGSQSKTGEDVWARVNVDAKSMPSMDPRKEFKSTESKEPQLDSREGRQESKGRKSGGEVYSMLATMLPFRTEAEPW
jgi:hypothetical protein